MPINELQRKVAVIALRAAARHGFALAGGNALIAHGIIDRPTEDVDLFSDQEMGVAAAAQAVEDALRNAGFQAERRDTTGGLEELFEGMGEGLAEWVITAPDGQQTMLQMAYFDRSRGPVRMDVGPVLDLEDLAAWKAIALLNRAEPRDYADIAAAMEHYTVDQLISFAMRLDPGLDRRDFAEARRYLDRMPDRLFARYGLSPEDVARLRERFAEWPAFDPGNLCPGAENVLAQRAASTARAGGPSHGRGIIAGGCRLSGARPPPARVSRSHGKHDHKYGDHLTGATPELTSHGISAVPGFPAGLGGPGCSPVPCGPR